MEVLVPAIIIIVFVGGIFLEIVLLSAPGAFIHWLIVGRKKSFKEFYRQRSITNYLLGVLAVFAVYIVIVLIVKLFV